MMQVIVPSFDCSDVFEVFVPGRPVPWKASRVGRGKDGKVHAKKDPLLVAWQRVVHWAAIVAAAAGGGRPAFTGPVGLYLEFRLEAEPGAVPGAIVTRPILFDERRGRWHKAGRTIADLTNLSKAVEDALQGVFYVDDTQVRASYQQCLWADPAGCGCRIVAASLADPGPPGAELAEPCRDSATTRS